MSELGSSSYPDTETGPGVFETALAYTDALRMADNAILFKFIAKSIGIKHGIMPSFMAKPWGNVSSSQILLCISMFRSFLDAAGAAAYMSVDVTDPSQAYTCLAT